MITDSFFQQGVTHEVCQDYSVHGPDYAIVSDGCSTAPDSDVGARILAKAAENKIGFLQETTTPIAAFSQFLYWLGIGIADGINYLSPLSEQCAAATLVLAAKRGDSIITTMFGDGVYGGKRKDGTWEIHVYNFLSGAPYYPSYSRKPEDKETYIKNFGDKYCQTVYTGDLFKEMNATVTELNYDFSVPYFWRSFPLEEFEFVFVGTDGLSSFYQTIKTTTSKHNEPISILDALRVIFDGINYNRPGFLRLQRNWAFKRKTTGTFLQRDWHNADDVSIAAIGCS